MVLNAAMEEMLTIRPGSFRSISRLATSQDKIQGPTRLVSNTLSINSSPAFPLSDEEKQARREERRARFESLSEEEKQEMRNRRQQRGAEGGERRQRGQRGQRRRGS